jgi:2,3-dihydroxy-p-cumate/2,3-dihydroxybenzoate 3,4-dioxygenase
MAPLCYREPGYVALNVSDLERSVRFNRDIVSLRLEQKIGDNIAFLRCSGDHHNLILHRNEVVRLRRIGFQLSRAGILSARTSMSPCKVGRPGQ